MTLQQGVVIASWEADKVGYVAKIGQGSVEGLGLITKQLGDDGWEIISVVPLESSGASSGSGSKATPRSRMAADVLAIFVKRYQDGPTDASRGGTFFSP
jgi:hypothetical protein